MKIPSQLIEDAVNHLSSLPGIGKRTALRLVLHMLKRKKENVINFGNSFINLISKINYCSECFNISEANICSVCADQKRDTSTICVVEDIRVMLAIENTLQYKGVYHILGGLISPINGIGPDKLKISELINRIEKNNVKEIILSLSTTMEGDTTNYYLFKKVEKYNIKISSIARGISIGDELEYTDQITLAAAISSRTPYENSVSTYKD